MAERSDVKQNAKPRERSRPKLFSFKTYHAATKTKSKEALFFDSFETNKSRRKRVNDLDLSIDNFLGYGTSSDSYFSTSVRSSSRSANSSSTSSKSSIASLPPSSPKMDVRIPPFIKMRSSDSLLFGLARNSESDFELDEDSPPTTSSEDSRSFSSGTAEEPLKLPDPVQIESMDLIEVAEYLPSILFEQYGSRYVQSLLEKSSSQHDLDYFFDKLMPYSKEVSNDVFGNYVLQSYASRGVTEYNTKLYKFLFQGNVETISKEKFGCRVLQKALESFETDLVEKIIDEILPVAYQLSFEEFGNHVIQKVLSIGMRTESIRKILDTIIDSIDEFSKDIYACRIVQTMMRNHYDYEKVKNLYPEIVKKTPEYIVHPFANFVIQQLLKTAPIEQVDESARTIEGQISVLTKSKFASNALEIYLDRKSPVGTRIIFDELCKDPQKLLENVNGEYANYIVQKVIIHGDEAQKRHVLRIIEENGDVISNMPFGKHVYNKFILGKTSERRPADTSAKRKRKTRRRRSNQR